MGWFSYLYLHTCSLLMMSQGAGRRAFWSVNGPRILQLGYEEEENPKVMGAYEQIGSLVLTSLPLSYSSLLTAYEQYEKLYFFDIYGQRE